MLFAGVAVVFLSGIAVGIGNCVVPPIVKFKVCGVVLYKPP